MLLNTFLGAIMRLVISQIAISKSIWGNLNMRLKNRGILTPSFAREDRLAGTPPNVDGPEYCLGRDMCALILEERKWTGTDGVEAVV
jgi:hypothetical protein